MEKGKRETKRGWQGLAVGGGCRGAPVLSIMIMYHSSTKSNFVKPTLAFISGCHCLVITKYFQMGFSHNSIILIGGYHV